MGKGIIRSIITLTLLLLFVTPVLAGTLPGIPDPGNRGNGEPELPAGVSEDWWSRVKQEILAESRVSSSSWTATGVGYFGCSVATAGDVNGDGYSDILVGARGFSSGTGKAYLYEGGPFGPSISPSWTATGSTADEKFGGCVATAGDVNGDGYSDVIIGAHGYSSDRGKAYLYEGSSSGLSPSPSWVFGGATGDGYFGYSVATAGDVNGDGYSDVIVGAYGFSGDSGNAYLFNGSPSGLSFGFSWIASGEAAGDKFGYSVGSAGDTNGDGYSEVIIGAYYFGSWTGKAYLYEGNSAGLSTTSSWSATGETEDDYFGYCVATAGDVNGDGFSDFLVGAYGFNGYTGKVYLYKGSFFGIASTPSWIAIGEGTASYFGRSVATAGDVNGDGYSDVIIGELYGGPSPASDQTNREGSSDVIRSPGCHPGHKGKAYIYKGGPYIPEASASWTAVGETNCSFFSIPSAAAGDVNGDGFGDVIIGTFGFGKAYLFYGSGCFAGLGDVNLSSTITALDASIVLQSVVGLVALTPEEVCRADVNENGSVTSLDAAYILMCVVGSCTELPTNDFRVSCSHFGGCI